MDFKEKLIRDLKEIPLTEIENFPYKLLWIDGEWVIKHRREMHYIATFDESEFDEAYDYLMEQKH